MIKFGCRMQREGGKELFQFQTGRIGWPPVRSPITRVNFFNISAGPFNIPFYIFPEINIQDKVQCRMQYNCRVLVEANSFTTGNFSSDCQESSNFYRMPSGEGSEERKNASTHKLANLGAALGEFHFLSMLHCFFSCLLCSCWAGWRTLTGTDVCPSIQQAFRSASSVNSLPREEKTSLTKL